MGGHNMGVGGKEIAPNFNPHLVSGALYFCINVCLSTVIPILFNCCINDNQTIVIRRLHLKSPFSRCFGGKVCDVYTLVCCVNQTGVQLSRCTA